MNPVIVVPPVDACTPRPRGLSYLIGHGKVSPILSTIYLSILPYISFAQTCSSHLYERELHYQRDPR